MTRSWVGRTIFACWPCMAMRRLREARHSYMNCENTEECYECAVVSRKMVDQIRSSPTLRYKGQFAYECLLRLSQGSRTGIVGGLTGRLRMPAAAVTRETVAWTARQWVARIRGGRA